MALLFMVALTGRVGTPRPLPGPACSGENGRIPIANQSSPTGVGDCPGQLLVHNASCGIEEGFSMGFAYHVGSACHGENDPNGPVYDARHGIYHLFFQDHVPMQVGGHLATKDFITWKRLPIAIWNSAWWDKDAIWTFSATVVPELNNAIRIVYPGIAGPNASLGDCGKGPSGARCFTHALALPSNDSDPWLVDWAKPADLNPIVADQIGEGSRDPSTAWRTAAGEWRYVDAKADVYSTWNWKTFTRVGSLPSLSHGDCPDFYPLPRASRDCSGSEVHAEAKLRPTHVAANVEYTLGVYAEGAQNTTGNFTPIETPAKPWQRAPSQGRLDSSGPTLYYAAKSFSDDKAPGGGERRIVWAWVRIGGAALEISDASGNLYSGFHPGGCDSIGSIQTNVNSLPREVTYDAALVQLLFFPIPELEKLRGGLLGEIKTPTKIKAGERLPVGHPTSSPPPDPVPSTSFAPSSAEWLTSELRIDFALPIAAGTRVGVEVRGGMGPDGTPFAVELFASFNGSMVALVGYNSSSISCPRYCKQCPLPTDRSNRTRCAAEAAPLRLKPSDSSLSLAVWTDGAVLEVFFMGGRSAWTVALPCKSIERGGGPAIFAEGGDVVVKSVSAWKMNSVVVQNIGDPDTQT